MVTYTPFTPPASTPSSTPPVVFSVAAQVPSTTPPVTFFPGVNGLLSSLDDLKNIPTVGVTPSANVAVETVIAGVTSVWALTAGTDSPDTTHVRPNDYNASTNAKHWLRVASH